MGIKIATTGFTGGIGSDVYEYFGGTAYDARKDKYPKGTDVLINCIGRNIDGMGHKMSISDFQYVIDTNLAVAFGITSLALMDMRPRGYGRIIHLSSMLSKKTIVGTSAYSASKAGLDAMVRVLAAENKAKGVLINSLNLGYIDAGMANGIEVPKAATGEVIRQIEVLISSEFTTGKNIDVAW